MTDRTSVRLEDSFSSSHSDSTRDSGSALIRQTCARSVPVRSTQSRGSVALEGSASRAT
jgi:hypothetical protein